MWISEQNEWSTFLYKTQQGIDLSALVLAIFGWQKIAALVFRPRSVPDLVFLILHLFLFCVCSVYPYDIPFVHFVFCHASLLREVGTLSGSLSHYIQNRTAKTNVGQVLTRISATHPMISVHRSDLLWETIRLGNYMSWHDLIWLTITPARLSKIAQCTLFSLFSPLSSLTSWWLWRYCVYTVVWTQSLSFPFPRGLFRIPMAFAC